MPNMSNNTLLAMLNNMQLAIPSTIPAVQPGTSVRPYVPRPVSNPMLSEWPPAKDNTLPKEGWFLLSDLWVIFLPIISMTCQTSHQARIAA